MSDRAPLVQRGFSLLEILVAFTLLAIALAVLMQIFSRGVNNADYAERYARASVLAESMLATIGVESTLAEGEDSGDFGNGYRWRTSIKLYSSTEEPAATIVNATSTYDPNNPAPTSVPGVTGNAAQRQPGTLGGVNIFGATPQGTAPTLGQAATLAQANGVDVETLLPVRLYEIDLAVVFTTDDGRERVVALNTLKLGPRP